MTQRVLIVKTSSLGDVVHLLPAVTDAYKHFPGISFDWVVEPAFADIPAMHPAVKRVIPCSIRQWRKTPLRTLQSNDWSTFKKALREHHYDKVIDAQGLIKSAVITRFARGTRYGLNWQSAWESAASLFYQRKISVDPDQHAVVRMRQLFANCFDYTFPTTVDYGLAKQVSPNAEQASALFFHGTTWETKHWPEAYWCALAAKAQGAGVLVKLPWGNPEEYERACRIAARVDGVEVLPKMGLAELAQCLQAASFAVAVDTGLGHLAAAFAVPTVSIYGATNAALTGTRGPEQMHLSSDFACAPCLSRQCKYTGVASEFPACYERVSPTDVWQAVTELCPAACQVNASGEVQ